MGDSSNKKHKHNPNMNISAFTIYLWGISENIQLVASIISFVSGVATLISGVGAAIITCPSEKDERESAKMVFRFASKVLIPSLLLAIAIPDKKTIACMVIVPAIVESKVIQQDVPELYNMAVESLKESLKK